MSNPTIASHFNGKEPIVQSIYDTLLARLTLYGEVNAVPKQTSIHLDNTSGFAGIYTRKNYINLHFRLTQEIDDPRITKVQKISAHRFKHTVKLETVADIDQQLLDWLKEAYELAG